MAEEGEHKDMMYIPALNQSVHVEGWDNMYGNERTRNRALTLQAMANLEAKMYTQQQKGPPTQQEIIEELIALGGTLSITSVYQVNKNIKRLMKDGHIVYRTDTREPEESGKKTRGRGGPTSPWATQYVYPLIKSILNNKL
jgi:hypothetical protein